MDSDSNPSEPATINNAIRDDWVLLCLACGHRKFLHITSDGGACHADQHRTQALWREGSLGGRCWCSAFASDPAAASLEILKHGDAAALVPAINEAIDERDLNGAQSLRTRLLRVSQKNERDDHWLADVERRLSELRNDTVEPQTVSTGAGLPSPSNTFVREGETWAIEFAGEKCRLPTARGLEYISVLLRNPGRPFSALELQGVLAKKPTGSLAANELASINAEAGEDNCLSPVKLDFTEQAQLDHESRKKAEQEMQKLEDRASRALTGGDRQLADQLMREYDEIASFLSKSLDKKGRSRVFAGENEKARTSIKKAIDRAIEKIRNQAPQTADYLKSNIETGSQATYRDCSTTWEVEDVQNP